MTEVSAEATAPRFAPKITVNLIACNSNKKLANYYYRNFCCTEGFRDESNCLMEVCYVDNEAF
jgi:hypothetical protein